MAKPKPENKPVKKWHRHKYSDTGRSEVTEGRNGKLLTSKQKKCSLCQATKWTRPS